MKLSNVIMLLFWVGSPAFAQTMEDYLPLPQDSSGKQALTVNPAIPDPDQFYLQYSQSQKHIESKFEISSNGVPAKVEQDIAITDHAFAAMFPVGGGTSLGLISQVLGQDHKTDFENASGIEEETFRKQYAALRIISKLAEKLRFGLDLRYARLENDIAGAFFIADEDRTQYKGSMTGFAIGLMYLDQMTRLGVSYTPPLRGKAKVEGEEIIIAEAGFIDLDIAYGKEKDWYTGFNVRRWLHQRDARSEVQESPENQRRVSYNGLHLDQFLLPTMRYSLGADTPYWQNTYMRLALAMNEYSFLFEDDQVPGDDEDLETKVSSYSGKLVGVYQPSDFSIHLGYSYETRKTDKINDSEGWFAGDYLNYKATESHFFAMFVYHP